ncbi:MAG: hypothetical protein ACR2QJ_16320 [Geminicoccaceae bacterium]
MSQALALAVLAGVISCGLRLAPWFGSFELALFSLFAPLPLMWVGLTTGLAAAIIAVVTAVVLNLLMVGPLSTFAFALTIAAPALLLVRQALLSRQTPDGLVWYPPGMILAQLCLLAIGGLAVAFYAFTGQPDGLPGVLDDMFSEFFELVSTAAGQPAPDPELMRALSSIVPAALACCWLIMIVINGILAQAIAVAMARNRRPSPEFAALELPLWIWPLMGAALFLGLVSAGDLGLVGHSALAVLIVPFGFLGLAVIHKFAGRWTHRQLGLAAIYVGIIVFGWPFLAVVALGLVEDLAHLRRYM